jgi:hypothetical protein
MTQHLNDAGVLSRSPTRRASNFRQVPEWSSGR